MATDGKKNNNNNNNNNTRIYITPYGRSVGRSMVVAQSKCSWMEVERRLNRSRIVVITVAQPLDAVLNRVPSVSAILALITLKWASTPSDKLTRLVALHKLTENSQLRATCLHRTRMISVPPSLWEFDIVAILSPADGQRNHVVAVPLIS